jgi:hypothetical protein
VTDILDRIATRLRLLSFTTRRHSARGLIVSGPSVNNVAVGELVVGDSRTIVVLAEIGPEAIASPRDALVWAARMGAGAIVLVGGLYAVRIAVPIDQIDDARWSDIITYASRFAADLAFSVSSTRRYADVSGLSHFGG